jgi:hypothetical protein
MATQIEFVAVFRDQTTPALQDLKGRIDNLGKSASGPATQGFNRLSAAGSRFAPIAGALSKTTGAVTTSLARLQQTTGVTQGKIIQMTSVVGSLSGATGSLVSRVAGLGAGFVGVLGPIGLVVTAATFLITKLKSMDEQASKTLSAVSRLNAEIVQNFQAAQAELARLDAQRSGDRVAIAQASTAKIIALAQQEREKKIREAESSQKAEVEIQTIRVAAEADASNKILIARRSLTIELEKIAQEQAATAQRVASTIASVASERAQAEARATGDILASIELERRSKLAAIQDTINAARQGSADREIAETTALDRIVLAEIEAAEKRKQATQGFISQALAAVRQLGPEFEDLREKLSIAQALEENNAALNAFQQIAEPLGLTTEDLAKAVEGLNDQAEDLARGITRTSRDIEEFGDEARDVTSDVSSLAEELVALGSIRVPALDLSDLADALDDLSSGELTDLREDLEGLGAVQFAPELIEQIDATIAKLNEAEVKVEEVNQAFETASADVVAGWREAAGAIVDAGSQALSIMQGIAGSANQSIQGLREQILRLQRQRGQRAEQRGFDRQIRELQERANQLRERGNEQQAQIIENQIQDRRDARAAKLDQERFNDQQQAIWERIAEIQEGALRALNTIATQSLRQQLASFQGGGTVPGPLGAPRLVVAHGGEEILPARRTQAPIPSSSQPGIPPLTINLVGTNLLNTEQAMRRLSIRLTDLFLDRLSRG